jgi:carbonic anhydrase/acetyltransferase-like protein (isoleucine patch superfamily)
MREGLAGRRPKPVRELRPEELEFFVHSAAHYAELKDAYRVV